MLLFLWISFRSSKLYFASLSSSYMHAVIQLYQVFEILEQTKLLCEASSSMLSSWSERTTTVAVTHSYGDIAGRWQQVTAGDAECHGGREPRTQIQVRRGTTPIFCAEQASQYLIHRPPHKILHSPYRLKVTYSTLV